MGYADKIRKPRTIHRQELRPLRNPARPRLKNYPLALICCLCDSDWWMPFKSPWEETRWQIFLEYATEGDR